MTLVEIREESDIVQARAAAKEVAAVIGFGLVDQTRISTSVSELSRNIFMYAGSGEVRIEEINAPQRGIRITFVDKGPGIQDIDLALMDGWSTSNSMGKGLPGAKRLMDRFDVHSEKGEGTTVIIEKWLED